MKYDNKVRTYKNDKINGIKVSTTGKWYDFIGFIENENDYPIYVVFNGDYEWLEPFKLEKQDNDFCWVGFLADEIGYNELKAFRKNCYEIIDSSDYRYEELEKGIY